MKIGFNLLLWTGHVTEENFPVIEKLKAAGYDGVEIPIFDVSNPAHFANIGQRAEGQRPRMHRRDRAA
jgi:D-psicose/D-tagatose/L-ribulose 3-epimerase